MPLCEHFVVVSAMLKIVRLRFAVAYFHECSHGQCIFIVCKTGWAEGDLCDVQLQLLSLLLTDCCLNAD